MANTRIKDISTAASSVAADDYLALDGATSGTRKITKENLSSSLDFMATGDVNDRSNSRGPVAGVNLGRYGYLAPGSAYPGTNPLQDNFTAVLTVRINKLVSHSPFIAMLTPGGTQSSNEHGSIHVNSNGTLDAGHYDGSDFNNLNDFLGGSVELGRAYRIAYRVNSGDDGLSVFVDGVKKGTVATGAGTSTTLRWNLGTSNTDNSNIEILGFTCYNRALSDSEIADEAVRQVPEVADQWGGAATYTSDFSSGVDGWSNINGSALDGNIDSIGGQNDNLRYTVGSSTGEKGVQLGSGWPAGNKRYRLTFDIYAPSGNSALDGYRIKHSVDGELKSQTLTADTWTSVTLEHLSTAQGNLKIISQAAGAEGYTGNGSDVFYLRNIKVTPIGAVVALLPTLGSIESDGTWLDSSSNELNGTPTGVTPLYTKPQVSGTWTPAIQFVSGGNNDATYTTQLGTWRKLSEKTVLIEMRLQLSGKGTDTSNATIIGFPFAAKNHTNKATTVAVLAKNMTGLSSGVIGEMGVNTTSMNLYDFASTGVTNLTASNFNATSDLQLSFVYEIE